MAARASWDFTDSEDEGVGAPAWGDSSDEEGERRPLSEAEKQERAGDKLANELLALLERGEARGGLSARSVCTLAYHAKEAGARGFVEQLAFRPNAPSGHFQRHLDVVLSFDEETKLLYELDVPGHDRCGMERVLHKMHTLPLHEELAREVADSPGLAEQFAASVRDNAWPPAYYEHPIVRESPGDVVYPLALYMDGIAYNKIDNVLAITVTNLASGKRLLCVSLRKELSCRCGCQNWCTLYPIMDFLHWCFQTLGEGLFPNRRHNGELWRSSDEYREALQDCPLGFKGALIQIKGDWAEFAKSLAFHNWGHRIRPCLFCDCTKEQ